MESLKANLSVVEVTVPAATIPRHTASPSSVLRIWYTISSFPMLMASLLMAGVYWRCRDGIADPDLWWHLRNAEYLFRTWHFPNIDTYSFSAAGSVWMNHEWLSEVFYCAAFNAFGLRGVFVLFTAAIAALIAGVFTLALRDSKDPFAAALTTAVGGVLATVGFGPRTQHFGWLCFLGLYAILLRFRATRNATLWLIPVLFCLWINCHGSWLIGLVIYGIFVCAGLVRRDIGRLTADPWTNAELKRLLATGAVSILALFINPFGYRLVSYPFDMMFRQKLNIASVAEWVSVDFNDGRGKLVAFVLAGILAMALIGRKKWRIDDALLMAFVVYAGLTHIRFLLLTGIVLPPLLTTHLHRLSSYDGRSDCRSVNCILLACIAAICFSAVPSRRMLDESMVGVFPVKAVEYLRIHPQPGRIFNTYAWGGYLEWNLPTTQTFIDSRTDIFEYKSVLKDYLDIIRLRNSQEILDRYNVSYILFDTDSSLAYFLSKSSRWERIYGDKQAVIYRRVQLTRL